MIEEPKPAVSAEPDILPVQPAATPVQKPLPKLGSLAAIRQKVAAEKCEEGEAEAQPLTLPGLTAAWKAFIDTLKEEKNPAWQSFEIATLTIVDDDSFQATVANNIDQKFLEFERNKVSEVLQQKFCNRMLRFSIILDESKAETTVIDLPLSSKDQYLKLIEHYPLVKELKDRLKMDLDY